MRHTLLDYRSDDVTATTSPQFPSFRAISGCGAGSGLAACVGARQTSGVTNTEDGWKTLTIAGDWVKVADTKAGVVITAGGVLAGLVLTGFPAYAQWSKQPWRVALLLTSLGLVCVAIVLALRVFAPRLRSADSVRGAAKGTAENSVSSADSADLLHFDAIAERFPNPEGYVAVVRELMADEERLARALAEQTWAVSVVARRKFRHVTPALWCLVMGLLVAVVAGVVPG